MLELFYGYGVFMNVTPTYFRAEDHAGKVVKVKALPNGIRQEFLELIAEIEQEILSNTIAREAWQVSKLKAIQFCLDSKETPLFRVALREALALLGLDYDQLDSRQVLEILFDDGSGQGKYWKLEFFPFTPSGDVFKSDLSPYYQAIGVYSAIVGSPYLAKQEVDQMTWPEINQILQARNEAFKASEKQKDKEKNPVNVTDKKGPTKAQKELHDQLMRTFKPVKEGMAETRYGSPEAAREAALARLGITPTHEGLEAPDRETPPQETLPQ